MNLVDTESKPKAGHRLDVVGVGREHPRAVGRTHSATASARRLGRGLVKNQCRGRAPPGCRPRRLSDRRRRGHTACAAECSRSRAVPSKHAPTWPEWTAQAEVHAAAPDLAPRTMGYVAIDDVDQPTTTFVGLSERVEGTPLSDLDILRPHHLTRASAALDRLHRLGFRHGDGHLGNFILGNDGTTIRIIDYEQAVRNAVLRAGRLRRPNFLNES